MGSLISLLIGIALLPLYLCAGVALAFIEWVYRGGPSVMFVFVQVIEYWHDRYAYSFTSVYPFIRKILDEFHSAANIARNAKIPIKPRWVWQRFWDVLSDPTAGCLSAISTGTLAIPLLRYFPFHIFDEIPRSHTTTASWVFASLFVGFASILLRATMDGALLANEARAGMRILRRLKQHDAGYIVLEEAKLDRIVPRDILDSYFFRELFTQTVNSIYVPNIITNIDPARTSTPTFPRVFSIHITPKGKSGGFKQPLESYAFMSVLGEQFVFLEGPIVPALVWHKFTSYMNAGICEILVVPFI